MKKFYKQAVTAISAVSLLATSCITGMSAKITDTNDFAVQYASSSGSHVAKVGVKNSSGEARTFNLYTAIYDAENPQSLSDVSVASHTIEAGKTEFFESNAITAESTDSIKVYAWEGMKPLEYGTDLRTLDKNAFLSDLSIGDYDVNVDNQNKKIYVNASGDISSAEISNIKISDKATYTVAEDNSSITVTSEDGLSVNKFDVVTSEGVYIDFEDGTIGEAPSGWTIDTRENCTEAVAADPYDSTNKVFMLDDKNLATGNDGKIGARYDFDAIKAPYTVSYKIMYDRDGVYADDGASATGTWLHVRNGGKNIMAVGSQDIGREIRYNVQHGLNDAGTGSLSYMSKKGFPNKTWHEITMVCLSEDEAKFYVDGELLYESAPTFFMDVTRLHFFSSTTRTSKTYIDDILVRPMECALEKISFTDGTNSVNGIIRDGKVYVNASDLSVLSVDTCKVSEGCTYTYENSIITVSSPYDVSVNYEVCAFEGVALDFESTETGSVPDGWSLSGMTDSTATVEADPENASNKVFKLDDRHLGTDKIGAQYNFTAVKPPFSVSYKVMYNRDSEYSNTGASINGTWMHVRNSGTNIVSGGSYDSASAQKFITKSKEGELRNDALINLGKWHEVEMVVLNESEAYFYVDGALIYTGSPVNYLAASRLNYFSSTTRTSTVYFDDIIVRPYYLEPCEIETVSFTDGENTVDAYVHENTVFVNAEALDGLDISECIVSENCDYTFENGVITVIPSEGLNRKYTLKAQKYYFDSFESYEAGVFEGSDNIGLSTSGTAAAGTVEALIAAENGGNVLVMNDTDGDNTNGQRIMFNLTGAPAAGSNSFIVDFDVKYDFVEGDTAHNSSGSDLGYIDVELRDPSNTKIGGVRTTGTNSGDSTKRTYNYATMSAAGTYNVRTTVTAGNWYNVKMLYRKSADGAKAWVDYYVDGEFKATESITAASTFSKIFVATSTKRRAELSMDNIRIISLD